MEIEPPLRVSVRFIESLKVLPRQNVLVTVQLSLLPSVRGTVLIEANDPYTAYNFLMH